MQIPRLPEVRNLRHFRVLGDKEELSDIWLNYDETLRGTIPQKSIRCIRVDQGLGSIFEGVEFLLLGDILCLEGELDHIIDYLRRTRRILSGMNLQQADLQRLLWRCVIALRFGKPGGITHSTQPRKIFNELGFIVEASFRHTVYVPAAIMRTLYHDYETDGNESMRSLVRLLDYDCDIWEPANGISLHVKAGVFVPDPFVIDLLGTALLEPGSKLRSDIQDKEVLEPCTGTGIIAITLARFGAGKVKASDIDPASINSAAVNVQRAKLSRRVHIALRSGLPERRNAEVVMVNPPWYGSRRQFRGIRWGRSAKRCYLDLDHRFLSTLLETAHRLTVPEAPVYVFMGRYDPLEDKPENAEGRLVSLKEIGWRISHRWNGDGHIRMYRLIKAACS